MTTWGEGFRACGMVATCRERCPTVGITAPGDYVTATDGQRDRSLRGVLFLAIAVQVWPGIHQRGRPPKPQPPSQAVPAALRWERKWERD